MHPERGPRQASACRDCQEDIRRQRFPFIHAEEIAGESTGPVGSAQHGKVGTRKNARISTSAQESTSNGHGDLYRNCIVFHPSDTGLHNYAPDSLHSQVLDCAAAGEYSENGFTITAAVHCKPRIGKSLRLFHRLIAAITPALSLSDGAAAALDCAGLRTL